MAKPKPAAKKAKRSAKAAAVRQRAARDVTVGPSAKRIDRSLDEGTTQTLDFFRDRINWR